MVGSFGYMCNEGIGSALAIEADDKETDDRVEVI